MEREAPSSTLLIKMATIESSTGNLQTNLTLKKMDAYIKKQVVKIVAKIKRARKKQKPEPLQVPLYMVPETGVEPVRCCHRGILSPVRLPIPPPGHIYRYGGRDRI